MKHQALPGGEKKPHALKHSLCQKVGHVHYIDKKDARHAQGVFRSPMVVGSTTSLRHWCPVHVRHLRGTLPDKEKEVVWLQSRPPALEMVHSNALQ